MGLCETQRAALKTIYAPTRAGSDVVFPGQPFGGEGEIAGWPTWISGAVRPVAQTAARLKEAAKLGFARALAPEAARGEALAESGIAVTNVGALASLVADIAARGRRPGSGLPRAIRQDG